jgi:DNA-binding Lrp family transcriptional regulator
MRQHVSWNSGRTILGVLQRRGPQTVAELSAAAGIGESSVRNRLSEMAAAGTVTRRPGRPARYALAMASVVIDPEPVPEPVEGSWRCFECSHGGKLLAWAGANAWGPLAANGRELAEHWDVCEWGVHEDSIECPDHLGAWLECFIGGQWLRWWSCPKCHGGGKYDSGRYSADCKRETPFPRRPYGFKGQTTVHEGWLAAEEHEAATAKAAS